MLLPFQWKRSATGHGLTTWPGQTIWLHETVRLINLCKAITLTFNKEKGTCFVSACETLPWWPLARLPYWISRIILQVPVAEGVGNTWRTGSGPQIWRLLIQWAHYSYFHICNVSWDACKGVIIGVWTTLPWKGTHSDNEHSSVTTAWRERAACSSAPRRWD